MATTRIKSEKNWTEERILALTREEVLELWGQAPAVEMAELCGEYKGLIPNAGNHPGTKLNIENMFNENSLNGYWMGKAFCPLSHTKGDGYNCWRRPGDKEERRVRFATEMGTSLVDGKPALMMYYGAYQLKSRPKGQENTLVDEIRKLADGVYLGAGTMVLPEGHEYSDGKGRSIPGHFVLLGPVGKWVGVDDFTEELK